MPTSFVKSACRPAAVMTGAGSSTPASAQVPVQTKANASPVAGTPATAAAVSCDGPMTTCGGRARPRPAATLGASGQLARRPEAGEQPGRHVEGVGDRCRPGHGARVEQAGGGGVGQLGAQLPGQPVGHRSGTSKACLAARSSAEPPSVLGWLANRWISRSANPRAVPRPTTTRPLDAPRSTAATLMASCARRLTVGTRPRPRNRRGCAAPWSATDRRRSGRRPRRPRGTAAPLSSAACAGRSRRPGPPP